MTARLCAAAVTTAALLAVPATAPAAIVPQKGMAGIDVGMTRDAVTEAAGAPTWSRFRRDVFGRLLHRYYATPKVHVILRPGQSGYEVLSLFTRSRNQRTSRGVGVGSSERTVRTSVPGARCETFRGPGFRDRVCYVGRWEAGELVTAFDIVGRKRPRVASVSVGRVID